MYQEYHKAFTEVYEILNLMSHQLQDKIPNEFYEMIKNERDINYFPNIKEPLEKQKLKKETIIILGLMYRDFLSSPEERIKLQKKDAEEFASITTIKFEKNNKSNIILEDTSNIIRSNNMLIIKEEKWYKKILIFTQKIFNKN